MSESERIPITVGVVGHLDVIATEEQHLQIIGFFRDLASVFPNSPVYLFSSLADGADRFVAKIFLDLKHASEKLWDRFELMMNVIYTRAESKALETETYNLTEENKNLYLKELFFVVGKEALIENGNWYLIFKEREPEIKGI